MSLTLLRSVSDHHLSMQHTKLSEGWQSSLENQSLFSSHLFQGSVDLQASPHGVPWLLEGAIIDLSTVALLLPFALDFLTDEIIGECPSTMLEAHRMATATASGKWTWWRDWWSTSAHESDRLRPKIYFDHVEERALRARELLDCAWSRANGVRFLSRTRIRHPTSPGVPSRPVGLHSLSDEREESRSTTKYQY